MSGLAHCFGGTRFVILVLSTLCLTLVMSNASVFNFAVICMQNNTNAGDDSWLSSPAKLNSLFSAPAMGAFLFTFPLSFFIGKLGLRLTFTLYCILTAVSTFFFPMAVQMGYAAVFLARFLQGIPTGVSFPATAQIAAQWTTEKGGATYISILTCHLQIAGMMAMMLTAGFCDSPFGWEGAFYFHGIVSSLLFVVFFLYYRDEPKKHKNVSKGELEAIQEGKALTHIHEDVPYRQICTDPCVWGIWLSISGSTIAMLIFIIYGPIYINKILEMDVAATGIATAIPNVIALVLKFVLGPISDKANCVSQRFRMILFAAVSQFFAAGFMILMAYTENRTLALICFTSVIVFGGLNAVGTIKCAQMVYGRHVHFVMAAVSIIFGITAQILPFGVGAVVPDHTREQWSVLLHITAVITLLTSVPFVFTAREEPMVVKKAQVEEEVHLRQDETAQ